MTDTAKPKGRPRAYDADQVLERSLAVFWRKGYSATSLDDLVAATGVNRPSLYAGFGDKQALYLQSMDRFARAMAQDMQTALGKRKKGESAADVLERCLIMIIDVYTRADEGPLGCAVFCTLAAEAPGNPAMRDALAHGLAGVEAIYTDFLQRAQADGELPADADVESLACLVSAGMLSIAMRARAGQPRAQMRRMARTTASLLRMPAGA